MMKNVRKSIMVVLIACLVISSLVVSASAQVGGRFKPVLHGKEWVAITGKPLGASAGAQIFAQGGNAMDAACAMLAVVCVMTDSLHFGGETQTLVYDPNENHVYGVNGMGHAYTGATPDFFFEQGMAFPPDSGILAASTPGTPRGLMYMLAEWGTMSLEQVLAPAISMAEGYPIESQLVGSISGSKNTIANWKYSAPIYLPNNGEPPRPGQIFVQKDLANTFRKLIETERRALANGATRKEAIEAANYRFYAGDIAQEFVRSSQEQGGQHTMEDLYYSGVEWWDLTKEEPLTVNYKGIDVYKLDSWTQGPVLLQMLNLLELVDMSKYQRGTAEYIHMIYQIMNLAYADRDFYYGDPRWEPKTPIKGLLSKEYAKERFKQINWEKNDPNVGPGDPYPYQGEENPFKDKLAAWKPNVTGIAFNDYWLERFLAGTTSVVAADSKGMVVSMTPSGGWIPVVIAGHTGVGMSQRMQQFIVDENLNPYNVVQPRKQPRVTLTPSLAMKDGLPYMAFAVQGGDTQDQNMIQMFLDVVEWGLDVQQACEGAQFTSYQMQSSFGDHSQYPGRIQLDNRIAKEEAEKLGAMGYDVRWRGELKVNSGPINAIWFDQENQTMWGGSSIHGEDYGIAW